MSIDSLEQYESALKLFDLLEALNISHVDDAIDNFVADYSEEWTICESCDNLKVDCNCESYRDYDGGCHCKDPDGKCYC